MAETIRKCPAEHCEKYEEGIRDAPGSYHRKDGLYTIGVVT